MIAVSIEEKGFGPLRVLGRLGFTVRDGETLAITGPSGIGKTTLLRILAGLDPDFSGEVTAPGRVAMVFQEPTLLPWRGALANITLTTGIDAVRAEAALAEVGLGGLGARFPGQLSLGQQRRLGLARAFSATPDLLLMDEPFASLDPARVEEMLALTESLLSRRSVATVFVTHQLHEARRLADRIVSLSGRPAQLHEIAPDPRPAASDLPA